MFGHRVPDSLRPNDIARRRRQLDVPFDLTVSNPTLCGFPYPETLLASLARSGGLAYRPEPLGVESARRAVAEDYRRHGVEIDAARVALTASSSEAYAFLFKLLCDPGDTVLVPSPSYPLFEHLAALDAVRAVPYRLEPEDGWRPLLPEVFPAGTRAVIAVHPNNPTGSFLDPQTGRGLVAACARTGAALIVDEVFLDYPLTPSEPPATFATTEGVLTFSLGGLSKSVGLPQVKLSWIVASGPVPRVEEALSRLEFVADNYLSVGTPVQLALPLLLIEGLPVREAILERCRVNLRSLRAAARAASPVSVPTPQGGWSAVVRFPSTIPEEGLALELLEQDGVAVHPGYFFDFPGDGYLVVSLLPEPAIFAEGVRRLLARIQARV